MSKFQVNYKMPDGNYSITVEGDTLEEVVDRLAEAQEVICVTASAKIKGELVESSDVVFKSREVDGNKYQEAVVRSGRLRGLKLAFGHKKAPKGTLFPRREMPEKNAVPGLYGWFWFKKEDEKATSNTPNTPTEESVPF